jgi:hypothetical protein
MKSWIHAPATLAEFENGNRDVFYVNHYINWELYDADFIKTKIG